MRVDDEARSSPFRVYSNNESETGKTYSGLSGLGLQVRFVPFSNIPELTMRTGFVSPVARDEVVRAQLNAQRLQLYLSGTYLNRLGPGSLAFLQGDFRTYLRSPENDASLIVPSGSAFMLFETPDDKWYFFPGISYTIVFQQYAKGYQYRYANQQLYGSFGVSYQPTRLFSVLWSGQLPFIFESGSSQAIWVRESYFGMNLGFRFLFD